MEMEKEKLKVYKRRFNENCSAMHDLLDEQEYNQMVQ